MPPIRLAGALVSFILSTLAATATAAQSSQGISPGDVLSGTVEFRGEPAAGIPVTLHRVTPQSSGEVGTEVTSAGGTFDFTLEPDPAAEFTLFFVTAENLGVRYFGPPVHSSTPVPEEYVVAVYDTAYVLPEPIRVPSRLMAMAALPDGGWEVNEAITFNNPNQAAKVAPPGQPAWQVNIPEGATDFEVGQGDIFPHEVTLMEDRVLLLTPLPPGSRLLLMRYRLPARPTRATVPIAEPTDTFNLFVLQPSHLSEVDGLPDLTRVASEGEEYMRYTGLGFESGDAIRLAWSGAMSSPVDPVLASVAVTLAILGLGAFAAYRNRSAAPAR